MYNLDHWNLKTVRILAARAGYETREWAEQMAAYAESKATRSQGRNQ